MRKFEELSMEELKLVFDHNSQLRDKVFDDMMDNAYFWCDEYLRCWKSGIDYCIGWDRGTYFKCTKEADFLTGLQKAQRGYCLLEDSYNKTIEYTISLLGRLDDIYWTASEENYSRLENRIDELIEELEDACYKRFMDEYESCFNREYQLDYFLDFYHSERMDGEFFVDEEYNLMEHIEYTKCYA